MSGYSVAATPAVTALDATGSLPAEAGEVAAVGSSLPSRTINHETGGASDFVPRTIKRRSSTAQVITSGTDFVPREVSKELREVRKQQANALARELWEQSKDEVMRYERAKEELGLRTPEQMDNPDEKTKRLLDIVQAGPPMTKQKALELATAAVEREYQRKAGRGS